MIYSVNVIHFSSIWNWSLKLDFHLPKKLEKFVIIDINCGNQLSEGFF